MVSNNIFSKIKLYYSQLIQELFWTNPEYLISLSDVEGNAENIKISLLQDPSDLAKPEDGKYSEVIFLIFKVCFYTLVGCDIIKLILNKKGK